MEKEKTNTSPQGLVSNGAKVYLVALPSDPINETVSELNDLGRESGGSAQGYVQKYYSFIKIKTLIYSFPDTLATFPRKRP